ncbi:M81 family metallopeptidase [Microbacteriaceae bacterium VKM Ac-2854]|nr:M81 family metallopeptidase [Microbacteriaceae bacterium VKM Ac-2854]
MERLPSVGVMTLPRIAVAGIAIESSVYSPALSPIENFVHFTGDGYFEHYPFFAAGGALRARAEWLPLHYYRSIPGGPVPQADWQRMKASILDDLAALGPVDGVLYDIHGAMSVVGTDDPEGELAAAIRAIVGPEALISTGMDLHGNVSPRLATEVDLLTAYRMAPHEDWLETKERAAVNLLDRLASGIRPLKAWIPVPILLPGEKTSTRIEPAKSLYARVPEVEARDGVLDAAIWIGYAWADEPRNHAVVMVTGDDAAAVAAGAEELAERMWAVRDEFAFVAPTGSFTECFDAAVASEQGPFFLSDSGDNPTAGGAGDVTWTLARLLEREEIVSGSVQAVYASIPGAEAVATAVEAGVGATVTVTVGALVDDIHEPPVTLTGVVEHILHGDPAADTEVVLRVGGLRVIVTARRKPYHLERDFTSNGIDARAADIVIVKIGYLEPELFDMSADWLLMLTPGGVDQDLANLPHHRILRPMVPFDVVTETPDLSARWM